MSTYTVQWKLYTIYYYNKRYRIPKLNPNLVQTSDIMKTTKYNKREKIVKVHALCL